MILGLFLQPQHPSYAKPGLHLRWRWGWLRAQLFYRPTWYVRSLLRLGPRVIWGQRICFMTPVRVMGPGTIFLGDDIVFDSRPDLYTHSPLARIQIGRKCFVNGARLGCSVKIQIGDGCILADTRLMDTDFHSLGKDRQFPTATIAEAPIFIGNNVWLSAASAVLKGVRIGDDSVIAFGSVVTKDVPPGKVFGGNPAKEIRDIPS